MVSICIRIPITLTRLSGLIKASALGAGSRKFESHKGSVLMQLIVEPPASLSMVTIYLPI